eukprot:Skav216387  [mRNA]  locus=scaffold1241:302911:307353:+ [translate_table: standard]
MDSSGGSALVLVTSVGMCRCGVQVAHCSGVMILPEKWIKHVSVGTTLTLCGFQVRWEQGEVCFDATGEGATILLHSNPRRGDQRLAEVFSGISGWSVAAKHLGVATHLFVDHDPIAAGACSRQHDIPMKPVDKAFLDALAGDDSPCVIVGSVDDPLVWMTFGLCNIAHVAGSPPCQPWSGAGYGSGLNSKDGMAFLDCVKWASLAHIQSFSAENVPGFSRHADFGKLMEGAENMGMSLRLHGVFQAHTVIPVQRDRWLGTFLHKDVGVDVQRLSLASSFSFAQGHLQEVCVCPSIATRDVIHTNLGNVEREALFVPDAAFQAMGNLQFAPKWLRDACDDLSPVSLVEGRTVSWDGPFKGFMACYGKQHEIDEQLLASKGLHTTIFHDDKGIRMISPWEMVATLAFDSKVILPCDIHDAWRVAGNALSPIQAFLQLFKTHLLLGNKTPFRGDANAQQVVKEILEHAIKLSHHETMVDGNFWSLIPVSPDETVEQCKKRKFDECIEPTIPFDIEEYDEIKLKGLDGLPIFFRVDDPRYDDGAQSLSEGGLALLLHSQHQWAMYVNFGSHATVQDVICRGLPHAKVEHFHAFSLNDRSVQWGDVVPTGKFQKLIFQVIHSNVKCDEQSLGISVNFRCDVTWTVKTACALIAAQVGCVPDTIGMVKDDRLMCDDEFLMGYDIVEAEFRFKACLPGYVSWEQTKLPSATASQDPGMQPVNGQVRWAARHPLQKVVRTAAVDAETTISMLVALLFPDVHATVAWNVFCNGVLVDCKEAVAKYPQLDIPWDSFRPLPVTVMRRISLVAPVDSPTVQSRIDNGVKRAVRSPFKAKHDEIWLCRRMTLTEIAASFFASSQVCTSILCQHGAVMMDPEMIAEHTPGFSVISFRVCPLIGGAKYDNVKQRVRQLLASKGVQEDDLGHRVSAFFAKVAPEKLNEHMKDKDQDFWDEVKRLATDCKYRLILPAELKAFQKDQRSQAKGSSDNNKKKGDKKPKSYVATQVDAHGVTIDPSHFIADGESVALLEIGRFGPDMTGLCPVTPVEARQVLKNAPWSMEALALLVIGDGAKALGKTACFPAHLLDGTPTTVDACLIQFGDIAIEPAIKLPSAMVEQLPSTVVEFTIERKLTGNWGDTAIPLHYIGVHVVALRGSALLSTWSIKSWKGDKPAHYSQSTHWHGFFRISDAILDQVLTRSGVAGIFMSPKNAQKKHDPRYIVIPLPNRELPEVHSKVESCSEVIGIVKLNEGFAARCKREDAASVRSQLLPESAYVETASFDADQSLFILRNVPQVGRDELSNALQKLGWNATAVRPQGVSRWVVAAKTEPPCDHLVLNGTIATVDSIQGQRNKKLMVVTQEYKVDTVMDAQNQVVSVSTSARYAEMRAQVETQIATAVDNRMAQANARIDELTCALESMKNEQTFTKQKIAEVENSVSQSSNLILTQMNNLFKEMDANMKASIAAMGESFDPEKRARIDKPQKADPFATKS